MHDSHHSSRTSAGRTSTVLLLGIVLLPVLYVLSIGPIIKLQSMGLLGPRDAPVHRLLEAFYMPLEWCLQSDIPVLSAALEWYAIHWMP